MKISQTKTYCIAMTHLWVILFYAFGFFWTYEAAKTMGPVGKIIINSAAECKENPANSDVSLKGEIRSVDGKGTKKLFATLDTKAPVDDSMNINVQVDKWEGGTWKTFYNYRGKFCSDIQKLMPKLWEKVRKQTKPPVPQPCPVKPGKYVLENFEASTNDFRIPAIFYGKLHVKFSILKNGKLLACMEGEGDSQAPI
ncbi:hypothetical protein ILUMI_08860 [Ignelater luminosus]|uniref:Uncharacterized protein n=1 Tax=Ignelater luminosus TaxID=2038154 RepID=A0A8K0GFL1_IGNLU|nr:hypothetical protein ILUMI_08860 [Ignelater luminosus]